MDRKLLAAGVVVLVAVVAVLAVVAGVVPPSGSDGDDGEGFPTQTRTPVEPTGGDEGDDATATPTTPPFELVIESIESCGRTCRDVTGRLENNQDRRATGVTVYTRIYAGDDTDGDVVWEGSQEVGELEAGGSERDTQRVELGVVEAAIVQNNDGEITIQTVIETDRQTVQFVDHRDVS